jgi:hypothetical protein
MLESSEHEDRRGGKLHPERLIREAFTLKSASASVSLDLGLVERESLQRPSS